MSEAGAADTLASFTIGQRGRIAGFDLPPEQRQRLLEMGMTVGSEFEIVRFAPLGDPIDLKVRGYHLSIRKHEAAGIHAARL
jgi:Fe2+ transport system protein FeoA